MAKLSCLQMILFALTIGNSREPTEGLTREFSNKVRYKANIQKSLGFFFFYIHSSHPTAPSLSAPPPPAPSPGPTAAF